MFNCKNQAIGLALLGVFLTAQPHVVSAATPCKTQKSQLRDAEKKLSVITKDQTKANRSLDSETARLERLILKRDSKSDQCEAKITNETEKQARNVDKYETQLTDLYAQLQTLGQQALQQCGIGGILGPGGIGGFLGLGNPEEESCIANLARKERQITEKITKTALRRDQAQDRGSRTIASVRKKCESQIAVVEKQRVRQLANVNKAAAKLPPLNAKVASAQALVDQKEAAYNQCLNPPTPAPGT